MGKDFLPDIGLADQMLDVIQNFVCLDSNAVRMKYGRMIEGLIHGEFASRYSPARKHNLGYNDVFKRDKKLCVSMLTYGKA